MWPEKFETFFHSFIGHTIREKLVDIYRHHQATVCYETIVSQKSKYL